MDNDKEKATNVNGTPSAVTALIPAGSATSGNQVRMSFNPGSAEGAIKLIKATLKDCANLEDKSKEVLELTDYIMHPASTSGEADGEVKDFTRIVVFDKDGTPYSCGSQGVEKAINILEMVAGKAPWNPPLKVKVTIRRLGNGRNWMILDPDMDSLTARLKGKK